MRTIGLKIRMWFAVILLGALMYALLSGISYAYGVTMPFFYAILVAIIVGFQFLIGPSIVARSMKVRWVGEHEQPWLHEIVYSLAKDAGIPKPKVGISNLKMPNAFAFGRSKKSSAVCVTKGILELLTKDELKAVLAHEISHIKHRDVVMMTGISAIPLLCFMAYRSIIFSSLFGGRNRNRGGGILIAGLAFALYILTNFIVLFVSRVREYYADAGSAELTDKPEDLASGLYRITLSNVNSDPREIKYTQGVKTLFAADPSKARREFNLLREVDLNHDGHLQRGEFELFVREARKEKIRSKSEFLSSHPATLKRIFRLGKYLD